ncbi:MAG: prolipoprotein diacylglyceryl transferase [Phycisphaerales bacterium]|nr:prolipoprotein diacylglyceryl transferase [Phycisphaerales bacterium]
MLLAESFIHDLDPFAWEISDAFGIRWYGLAYLTGFVVAWLILKWLASTNRILLKPNQVGDFLTWLIVGVLLGGRLGYVLLYSPDLLWTFHGSIPFWGVLEIHKGGMASHGGMAGVVIAAILYARRIGLIPWHLLDIVGFIAPPGLGLGRVANFVNGELWGRPLPESMRADPPAWSIKYPDEILVETYPRAAEVDALAVSSIEIPAGESGRQALRDAVYSGRDDIAESLAPYLTPYYPSSLFQATSDGLVLFIALVLVWLVPRKPGIITGAFLIVYGILRVLTEQYREQFTTNWGYSSMVVAGGLSAIMVLIGIGILVYCARGKSDPVGGLLPRSSAQGA